MSKRRPTDDEIPHSLEVLWGRREGRLPGPRRALSRERIVTAAIQIADREGLGALSMARLAERMGCATMSLYRHVANKDELQVFMMDAAPGLPPSRSASAGGWRAALSGWALALQAVYYRHPWILQITTGRPPLEPGQLAWLDAGLVALQETRLRPEHKLSVILLVLDYVRGEAQITTGLLQAHQRTPQQARAMEAWYARMLARLVDAKRFPALFELVRAGVFDPGGGTPGPDAGFEFGLARLLDGVEAFVGSGGGPSRRPASRS